MLLPTITSHPADPFHEELPADARHFSAEKGSKWPWFGGLTENPFQRVVIARLLAALSCLKELEGLHACGLG